jgi:hypothetical protein
MGMLVSSRNKFLPPLAVLFTGLLSFGACASLDLPPESGVARNSPAQSDPAETARPAPRGAEEAALPAYREEPRIPLWEEPPRSLAAEDVPALTIKLELIDFSGEGPDQERLLNAVFYRGLGVRDYARELVRVQTIEYREMGEEARNNPAMAYSATLNWEYGESLRAGPVSPRLLVIARDRSFYSGGAHPNYDRTYSVFDREVAMRVRLADIVREESRPALKRLVNRELRAAKKLGPGDSLKKAQFFVDEVELPENFFLSPQGLGFHWDPYEIASYAEGFIEAIVPFDELTAFLSPEGHRLARELRTE